MKALVPAPVKKVVRFLRGTRQMPAKEPVPSTLTNELRRLNAAAASRFGVAPSVHPKDFIYWYVLNLPSLATAKKQSTITLRTGTARPRNSPI